MTARPTARAARLALLAHAATPATRAARFPAGEAAEDAALDRLRRASLRLPAHDRCLAGPAAAPLGTAHALGLDPAPEPALRDQDFGRWAGRSLAAVAATEPEAVAAWLADPAAAPHGGETVEALLARVGDWMDGVAAGGPVRLLAVTHPAIVRAAVAHALGAGAGAFWRIDAGPLVLAEFGAGGGRWRLRALRPA